MFGFLFRRFRPRLALVVGVVVGLAFGTTGLSALQGSASARSHQSLGASHLTVSSGVTQAPALPGAQSISSQDRIYTADQTSNTVTVINPATNTVLGTIALGDSRLTNVLGPQYLRAVDVHGLGLSRDGKYINVISVTTNTVTVVRTADNSIVSQTYVGRASHEGFFSPDGKTVWVADRALARVDIVDALRGGVVGHINTADGPSKVLFSPDGRYAYVDHIRSATIDIIKVSNRRVVGQVTGLADAFSSDEGLSADGTILWAAHKKSGQVSIIDVVNRRVTSTLDTGPDTNHPNFVDTADGQYVYLTVGGLNETKVYRQDSASAKPNYIGAVESSGVEPHGIWPSPDNTRIYVVNEHSDTVDVIDTASRKVVDTLNVGQEGQALIYVAGAVTDGSGEQNLSRQGLDKRIENAPVTVDQPGASAAVTVRALTGLDMVEIMGRGLTPNASYTASATFKGFQIPIVTFTTDGKGSAPQVLAFTQFFGVYDIHSLTVRPTSPLS